jgi:uncharacterized membrane protein YcaP (DUF421 family)
MSSMFQLDWQQMFVPTVPILEIVLRGTLMYLGLFLLMRFIMRRDPGDLSLADVLLVVILADAAQNGMAGEYRSITEGVILVATLICWNYALDWLAYRSPFMQRILEPPPLLLIKNGRMLKHNMRQEMITEEELRGQLRQHGVATVSEVKEARMESDGHISVIRKQK